MKRNIIILLLILLLSAGVIVGWCSSQGNQAQEASLHQADLSHAASHAHSGQAHAEPMSLVAIMGLMITEIQQVGHGIFNENYALIEKSAAGIADHPPIRTEDLQLVKETLGQQAEKFEQLDEQVHHHADSMRLAAGRKDMDEILRQYSVVQHGCVECHARFRSRIVNARNSEKRL